MRMEGDNNETRLLPAVCMLSAARGGMAGFAVCSRFVLDGGVQPAVRPAYD